MLQKFLQMNYSHKSVGVATISWLDPQLCKSCLPKIFPATLSHVPIVLPRNPIFLIFKQGSCNNFFQWSLYKKIDSWFWFLERERMRIFISAKCFFEIHCCCSFERRLPDSCDWIWSNWQGNHWGEILFFVIRILIRIVFNPDLGADITLPYKTAAWTHTQHSPTDNCGRHSFVKVLILKCWSFAGICSDS